MANKPSNYGFVYIWFDRKHKRYYIGCHWGPEDDGYICSSTWMKHAYDTRPNDFRRRILSRVFSKQELLEEEYRWLSMIKPHELRVRYYNLHNHKFSHWSYEKGSYKTVGQKISQKLKGRINGPPSEETRSKIAKSNTGKVRSEEAKRKVSEAKKGVPVHSDEEKERRRQKTKEAWEQGVYKDNFGRKQSAEQIEARVGKLRGRERTPEEKEAIAKKNSKSYKIVFEDGREEVVCGLKDFGKQKSIPYVTLFKAAQQGHSVPKYKITSINLL